jgi:hypothetical protein
VKRLLTAEKGVALITTLAFMLVMAVLVATFLDVTTVETRELKGRSDLTNSFWYAEAGLHKSQWLILTPGSRPRPRCGSGSGFTYRTGPRGCEETFEGGKYKFVVTRNGTLRTITSKGTYRNLSRQVEQRFNVVTEGFFNSAVFGTVSGNMSGTTLIDSYDSRTGSYDPGRAGANSQLGTNSTAANAIQLSGNARLRGDAVAGPRSDVSTAISVTDSAVIEGRKRSAYRAKSLPAVTIPRGLRNRGNLVVNGTVRQFAQGTYLFSSITVRNGGTLRFRGTSTVYVTGDVVVQSRGHMKPTNDRPTSLTVLVRGERLFRVEENGSASRQARFFGALYGPDSEIRLQGRGEVFGSSVGKTGRLEDTAKVHFDEALRASRRNGPLSSTTTLDPAEDTWREIVPAPSG